MHAVGRNGHATEGKWHDELQAAAHAAGPHVRLSPNRAIAYQVALLTRWTSCGCATLPKSAIANRGTFSRRDADILHGGW